MRPLIVTPGMGVGPEVTARALAAAPPRRPVVLLGRAEPMAEAAAAAGLTVERIGELSEFSGEGIALCEPDGRGDPEGRTPPEVAAIRAAAGECLAGRAAALVTGPIHKAKLAAQGFRYAGHTDFLGDLCGVDEPVMAFVGGELRVALVTVHVPLAAVPAALTPARIGAVVRAARRALSEDLGLESPTILVCGLNPHAGEGGLLGREEIEVIGPACDALRAEGIRLEGPVSAETAFLQARQGRGDLVVAMYHDQGLAPLKAVDFGRSVNWTLGLPILRTSVDHGTADSLVGAGLADPASMSAALALAERIADRREARQNHQDPSTIIARKPSSNSPG